MAPIEHHIEQLFEKVTHQVLGPNRKVVGNYKVLYVPHCEGAREIKKGEKYPFFVNFNFWEDGNISTNETAVVYEDRVVGFYNREIDKGHIQSKYEAEHIFFRKLHRQPNLLSLLSNPELPDYIKNEIKSAFCVNDHQKAFAVK